MEFTPEHYFQTAAQRTHQAHYIYDESSSYALAIYVGGVAVECLLGVFKGRRDPMFDESPMAVLKSPIVRKLSRALKGRFPPPAKVKLEDCDGVIGVITSPEFARLDTIDRQNLIGQVIAAHLTPEERRRVQVIVGGTPDEGDGYLAIGD